MKLCDKQKTTWTCLFAGYFLAYYNGEFIDRNGGTYSKPKLGLTISNEVISSTAAIFIEALVDYTLIDAPAVYAPIVFRLKDRKPANAEEHERSMRRTASKEVSDGPKEIGWLTKDNKQPTFVDIAEALGIWDHKNPTAKGRPLIEEESKSPDSGMDQPRLCVARYLGGAAGDAAQPLTGVIVRAVGGANLGVTFGLGALGKFSLGDNDTLTKLVDTVVENLPRRLSEAAVEHALYGPGASSNQTWKQAVGLARWISRCEPASES